MQIDLDVTIWYKLMPSEAARVYQTIGADYVTKIVRPAIRTAIRDVTVKYAVVDIYSEKERKSLRKSKKNLIKLLKNVALFAKEYFFVMLNYLKR